MRWSGNIALGERYLLAKSIGLFPTRCRIIRIAVTLVRFGCLTQ